MSNLSDEFIIICSRLNEAGIVPTLMGSPGPEYVSRVNREPADIDIHVTGDPRGWEAPDELRINDWDKIKPIMEEPGYRLTDLHEFLKDGIHAEYGSISSLLDFAGISESDIEVVQYDGVRFRVPSLKQFLTVYRASSKDSYRNDHNNNKDFKKIDRLNCHL